MSFFFFITENFELFDILEKIYLYQYLCVIMKIRSLIFILLITLTCLSATYGKSSVQTAVKGVLDLRKVNNPAHFIVTLNGDWEFYWNEMLNPSDFREQRAKSPYYGKVPSYWTDYPKDKIQTAKYGFATYRLIVLLPHDTGTNFGIDLPVFDSSYQIYLNGKLMGGNGTPGKSESETKPGYKRNYFDLSSASDSLEIIINVSNFHHRRGGFWLPVSLGTHNEVIIQMANSRAGELSAMALLLGFSIFFLFFFLLNPNEKIMAYFSLSAIGLALRPLFTAHYAINDLINIDWVWIIRFEYIGLYIVAIGWAWFNLSLYPSKHFRFIVIIYTISYLAALMLTLFLPVRIFSYIMLVYYPSMILLIGYALVRSFQGTIKKKITDIIYFGAFIVLLLAGIHDIRIAQSSSDGSSGYILTYFIILLVFIQAGILLLRWGKDYNERVRLQGELEAINRSLEARVEERTNELKIRNEEIEEQNKKIADQNKKLSETIQLKDKVFSVIAHDLRAPVSNILYMLYMLKENAHKEENETFTNYSISYAQNVISLIENMLVWGRGQEEKIKYTPDLWDVDPIILKNMSIFKEIADKKEISVEYRREGELKVFADKDLLDIIVRNLLSNAVKYTPHGGSIKIHVQDDISELKNISIKICDTGVGIAEEKQYNLFTLSEIESTKGTDNETGTGLGLKLCYELVKLNQGNITLSSTPAKGTCFTIKLPSA